MKRVLVTGATSGLGLAISSALVAFNDQIVMEYDHSNGYDVREPDKEAIDRFAPEILINCAGVNLINWLEDVKSEEWDAVMDINAKGIFMMTQACLPHLIEAKGTVVNIVSNAAHMPMTCSLAYNASKGAAHIMTLQLARELTKKHGITVFGIAPNKLAGTEMSKSIDEQVVRTRGWTWEYAHQYQLNGLLTGEETPPNRVAEFLAFLLRSKEHHKYLTGTVIPYGA